MLASTFDSDERSSYYKVYALSVYVYLPHEWSLGAPKICNFEILKPTEMKKPPSSTPGGDRHMRPLTF